MEKLTFIEKPTSDFKDKSEFLNYCKANKIQGDKELLWVALGLNGKVRLFYYEEVSYAPVE